MRSDITAAGGKRGGTGGRGKGGYTRSWAATEKTKELKGWNSARGVDGGKME